jgi:hypothetical protein
MAIGGDSKIEGKHMSTKTKEGSKLTATRNGARSKAEETPMQLPVLNIKKAEIWLIGTSELIQHKWSGKAKKEMLDKQMGKATAGKQPKNPEQDYQEATYHDGKGGYQFPAVAFKSAAVTACTSLGKSITKVAARQAFHIYDEFVPIFGEPHMREDMVKIGMGTADLRYRPGFRKWGSKFVVHYNANVLTCEQVVQLFNMAGFAVGVGEWRPEKNGQYGLFAISDEAELKAEGLLK